MGVAQSEPTTAPLDCDDASTQRINALEAALGDANRELRARMQAVDQLAQRVEELSRVVEEQRLLISSKDAEIVRLTAEAQLSAQMPKRSRTRQRATRDSFSVEAHSPTGGGSSVVSLPPLGGQSHSSMA